MNYESLNRKPIQKLDHFRNKEVDNWTMIAKFNNEKYNQELTVINKHKNERQREINNILRDSQQMRLNKDDYYDNLEKETLHKLALNTAMKEKTLKDKLLSNQGTRNDFAKSKQL